MKTNVPSLSITPAGILLPSESDILSGVLADFNEAFGGNMNIDNLETPQGQLASSFAAIISDKNNQLAYLMNQVHPDYAEGVMQDAIAKIYFIERKSEVKSSVVCEFMGLSGVVIPSGFIVKDANGNDWSLTNKVVIGSSGVASGTLTASHDVSAAEGTVNVIFQSIMGLDRVTNHQDSVKGYPAESQEDFRIRRQKSVALNSNGMPESVYANVSILQDVTDVFVIDNPKGEPVEIRGQTLKPHSIYVAVNGGNDYEIAKQIWKFTGNGCDYNGNTSVTVYDDNYAEPKPSYEILFTRPKSVPIYFKVRIAPGAAFGYEIDVQKAVVSHFASLKLSRIGQSVFSADFFQPVMQLPNLRLLDIQVSEKRSDWREEVKIGIDSIPSISEDNIEVVSG